MKEPFDQLLKALELNRKKCPWSNDASLESFITELESEIKEVKQAIENKDPVNLKEELGDAFMDLLFLIIIAEEKGLFKGADVLEDVKQKLMRRKPWVFGNEIVKDKEHAMQRWKEQKLQEKKTA